MGPHAIFFKMASTHKKATEAQNTVPTDTLSNPSMDVLCLAQSAYY
jgi:hypothetical protein